jgi:hypothetical protein
MIDTKHEIEMALREILGQPTGRGRTYQATTPLTRRAADFDLWERSEPVSHRRTVMGDYVVPLLQTLTTGGLIGGALHIAGMGGSWPRLIGATSAILWWLKANWESRPFVWKREQILGRDIDQDGYVGQPPVMLYSPQMGADPPVILRASANARRQPMGLPATVDVTPPNRRLARDLAEFLAMGDRHGFGIRDLKGAVLSSGTEITDTRWREFTQTLRDAGILTSDNSGTRLLVGLDEALRAIW